MNTNQQAATGEGNAPREHPGVHKDDPNFWLNRGFNQGAAPRKFRLTLADNDGETHEYSVQASNPWQVLKYVCEQINARDFYGHTLAQAQDVKLEELVSDAEGSFIIL